MKGAGGSRLKEASGHSVFLYRGNRSAQASPGSRVFFRMPASVSGGPCARKQSLEYKAGARPLRAASEDSVLRFPRSHRAPGEKSFASVVSPRLLNH